MAKGSELRTEVSLLVDHSGCAAGGIRTLLGLLIQELEQRGQRPQLVRGCWPALTPQLVVLGCSSPWAYGQLLRHRLTYPKSPPRWVPCFHPPEHVRHPRKARLARFALRWAQRLGIRVLVLSQQELQQLDTGRCRIISLGFGRTQPGPSGANAAERPIDLVFLGRPTAQKGWPLFVGVVKRTGRPARAYVPFQPADTACLPVNLELMVAASDAAVIRGLKGSKLLLLPADYESFGFAQAEALACGCCVPVLGDWPLWLGIPELDWRGLDGPDITYQVMTLLASDQTWMLLQRRQQQNWESRVERQAPRWIEQ